jgi:hypothetical protein
MHAGKSAGLPPKRGAAPARERADYAPAREFRTSRKQSPRVHTTVTVWRVCAGAREVGGGSPRGRCAGRVTARLAKRSFSARRGDADGDNGAEAVSRQTQCACLCPPAAGRAACAHACSLLGRCRHAGRSRCAYLYEVRACVRAGVRAGEGERVCGVCERGANGCGQHPKTVTGIRVAFAAHLPVLQASCRALCAAAPGCWHSCCRAHMQPWSRSRVARRFWAVTRRAARLSPTLLPSRSVIGKCGTARLLLMFYVCPLAEF